MTWFAELVEQKICEERLASAAPDLLAALKTLLAFDDVREANDAGPRGEGWQSSELIRALAACDEAIAKAEGHR